RVRPVLLMTQNARLETGVHLLFSDGHKLIRVHTGELFGISVGPADPDSFHAGCAAESEMDSHVVMGKITFPAPDFVNLGLSSRLNLNPGPNRISIGARAFQAQRDPVIPVSSVI